MRSKLTRPDFYHLDYLSSPKSKRRSRGFSIRSNNSNRPMSPTSAHRPSSPTVGRKKLNLAFVEDPLLAAAAHNALSPEQQEPDPEPAPQLQANPTPAASVPTSSSHSRVSSVASDFSFQHDLSAMSKLSMKVPPPDSAVGDLDIDRWDEIETEYQEPNYDFPYLVTHSKVYAIAEK